MAKEKSDNKGKANIVIIILMVVIIALVSIIGYVLISNKQIPIVAKAEKSEEHTLLLEEFIVNLRSENNTKNYLKTKIALMYTEEKKAEVLEANVNKLRDIILLQLREKSAKEMLDVQNIPTIKKAMIDDINEALKETIVKDVYFTDMVIQ